MNVPETPHEYPPFSGDDPVCPKCLKVGASTEYRAHGECVHDHGGMGTVVGFGSNPRLHRECLRCSYAWDEHTALPAKTRPHP